MLTANPASETIGESMDEQEFKKQADVALESLYKKLSAATDRYDFEPDFNAGALSIEFEEPKARFVISPNSPVRQIWVSAHSKKFQTRLGASPKRLSCCLKLRKLWSR